MEKELAPHRARAARDDGLRRLRRLTGAAVATALGLSGIFAGIAASSTHPRRTARLPRTTAARPTRKASTPALPPARAPGMAAPSSSVTPTPPGVSPAPAESPPVAVSGGS
jgi:hypothetical protein